MGFMWALYGQNGRPHWSRFLVTVVKPKPPITTTNVVSQSEFEAGNTQPSPSAGKLALVRQSHVWFWFYFWLVGNKTMLVRADDCFSVAQKQSLKPLLWNSWNRINLSFLNSTSVCIFKCKIVLSKSCSILSTPFKSYVSSCMVHRFVAWVGICMSLAVVSVLGFADARFSDINMTVHYVKSADETAPLATVWSVNRLLTLAPRSPGETELPLGGGLGRGDGWHFRLHT